VEAPFAILALGKLGARTDYSSDVDLMLSMAMAKNRRRERFQSRILFAGPSTRPETLSRVTPEGPVFRIDLRLRRRAGKGS